MHASKVEHLKTMLSRGSDGPVRLAYGRLPVEKPRHFVIMGTTNAAAYLDDPTGNRRFWPVVVNTIRLPEIRRDRDQLWAEAVVRWKDPEHGGPASIRLAGYLLHSGDPNMLWSPDHGILAYLTNDS